MEINILEAILMTPEHIILSPDACLVDAGLSEDDAAQPDG